MHPLSFSDVKIKKFYTLKYGRCFTFIPTNPSSTFTEIGGYMLQFHHTDTEKTRNFYGISLAGYHTYIHEHNQILRGTANLLLKLKICFQIAYFY